MGINWFVERIMDEKHRCLVAVSEGITYKDGSFVAKATKAVDAFGHARLGGVASSLASEIDEKLGLNAKSIELSFLQRGAYLVASKTDIEEGVNVGRKAVEFALNGETDRMVTIIRTSDNPYKVEYKSCHLQDVANIEKKVPLEWITKEGNNLTSEFTKYCLPLIEGELEHSFKNGLLDIPHFKNYRK